jgi:hypothetical protein
MNKGNKYTQNLSLFKDVLLRTNYGFRIVEFGFRICDHP